MPGLWICMIIWHGWQAFVDALGSKSARVLNMARLYMQGLRRVPNMSVHGSIPLINDWICLVIPFYTSQYTWTWLNIAECPWIYLIMPKKIALTIPEFSICRDIVLATWYFETSAITLELLSALFVHPGALLSFYIFLNTS